MRHRLHSQRCRGSVAVGLCLSLLVALPASQVQATTSSAVLAITAATRHCGAVPRGGNGAVSAAVVNLAACDLHALEGRANAAASVSTTASEQCKASASSKTSADEHRLAASAGAAVVWSKPVTELIAYMQREENWYSHHGKTKGIKRAAKNLLGHTLANLHGVTRAASTLERDLRGSSVALKHPCGVARAASTVASEAGDSASAAATINDDGSRALGDLNEAQGAVSASSAPAEQALTLAFQPQAATGTAPGTFVPIWQVMAPEPGGCSEAMTSGYSLSGPIDQSEIGCGWNSNGPVEINGTEEPEGTVDYVWLHEGAHVSYSFTVPPGTSQEIAYGIPAGGDLNNAPATLSGVGPPATVCDGGTSPSDCSALPSFHATAPSDTILWTSSALSPGTYTLTITSDGAAVNVYGVWMTPVGGPSPLSITTSSLALYTFPPPSYVYASPLTTISGTVEYSSPLTATGGVPPYTWSISGAIPPGLHVSQTGPTSAVLTGTITTFNYLDWPVSVGIRATDSQGSVALKTLPLSWTPLPNAQFFDVKINPGHYPSTLCLPYDSTQTVQQIEICGPSTGIPDLLNHVIPVTVSAVGLTTACNADLAIFAGEVFLGEPEDIPADIATHVIVSVVQNAIAGKVCSQVDIQARIIEALSELLTPSGGTTRWGCPPIPSGTIICNAELTVPAGDFDKTTKVVVKPGHATSRIPRGEAVTSTIIQVSWAGGHRLRHPATLSLALKRAAAHSTSSDIAIWEDGKWRKLRSRVASGRASAPIDAPGTYMAFSGAKG